MEFEKGLEDHQRAKVEGGGTVLERAVREHNVAACGKVCFFFVSTLAPLCCYLVSACLCLRLHPLRLANGLVDRQMPTLAMADSCPCSWIEMYGTGLIGL